MRLTKDVKEGILHNAIAKAGLYVRRDEARVAVAEWGEDVRIYSLGGPEVHKKLQALKKRIEKAAEGFPDGLVRPDRIAHTRSFMRGATGGERFYEMFYDDEGHQVSRECGLSDVLLAADHELSVRRTLVEDERDAVAIEISDLSQAVWAVLNSVTTVKKLVAGWPEVAELLPPENKPTASALAVPVADLNKLIGLSE